MSISYPPLPEVESTSENEEGSTWGSRGQNGKALAPDMSMEKVGEESDGVNQISGLLKKLAIKPDKNSKESSKKPGKNSSSNKENDKKSNTELEQSSQKPIKNSSKENGKKSNMKSGESSKSPGKNPSKENGKKSVSDDRNSEDESSAEHTKATHYTSEQRDAATRIQHCSKKDYYSILGLDENCSKKEIKDAYRKLSLLTHPDKNKYKDAPTAFNS